VVPFGHDREAQPTAAVKVLLTLLGLGAGTAVAVAGWRRRQPVIAALGAVSVVGPLVAVWSGTRIVGEVFPYLLLWTSPLLLPAIIGAAALLSPSDDRRLAVWLPGAAAVVVGLSLTVTLARTPFPPYETHNDVLGAARLAEPWLAGRGVRHVRVGIADFDQWPLATGVAVRLEKDGFTATVDREWTSLFGEHFRPTGHEQATVWIADPDGPPPAEGPPASLGVAGKASIWVSSSVFRTP